ncbi:hypothetical protein EJ08DRAFT_411291 [Tothia fuscella]|uniref:Uncharacterized protein n=1 Tax=Tothia fuscella TaxID=1048955 RepID=A0A9P4NK56_9PEZI|nr:hypothetical protein EJ08DRAFT_411291 [Tothia fuscella]
MAGMTVEKFLIDFQGERPLRLVMENSLPPRITQKAFGEVRSLHLELWGIYDGEPVGKLISQMPNLESLSLDIEKIGDGENVEFLVEFFPELHLKHLQQLSLRNTDVGPDGLLVFLERHVSHLRQLELLDVRFQNNRQKIDFLSILQNAQSLEHLAVQMATPILETSAAVVVFTGVVCAQLMTLAGKLGLTGSV